VPDVYQGSELWDLSLVDPDNRRPVDYAARRKALAGLREAADKAGADLRPLTRDLLSNWPDGRVKLYILWRTLTFRSAHASLFAEGTYVPLETTGDRAAHVVAFRRGLEEEAAVVVVPRLVHGLVGGRELPPMGALAWGDTWLSLPDGDLGRTYRHHFTGETFVAGERGLALSAVLGHFPVALLSRLPQG
jgi:(1->4)-alpha-D-glucan 1-alpha-D-glucosylmutase